MSTPTLPRGILVDIDATLYDTTDAWIRLFDRMHGVKIGAADISTWNFWQGRMSLEQFLEVCAALHHPDLIASTVPFPGAAETLREWAASGCLIHVVSDRAPTAIPATKAWLTRHGIPHVALACANPIDKIAYARTHGLGLVIDDKPATLEAAVAAGLRTATLTYPYNADALASHPAIARGRDWPTMIADLHRRQPRTA